MPPTLCWVDIDPILVRPHQSELHLLSVRCLEEAFVERAIEKRTAARPLEVSGDVRRHRRGVPIPVKEKEIDPIRRRCFNLRRKDGGIVLRGVDTKSGGRERNVWLQVTRVAWLRIERELPLGPAWAVQLRVLLVDVPVTEVDGTHRWFLRDDDG